MLHLGMNNRPEVACVRDLVQGDFLGPLILDVAHSAVGKGVPLDLQLAKRTLNGG
jgi:hypothetical protein